MQGWKISWPSTLWSQNHSGEGTSPPYGLIDSLSQEELALCIVHWRKPCYRVKLSLLLSPIWNASILHALHEPGNMAPSSLTCQLPICHWHGEKGLTQGMPTNLSTLEKYVNTVLLGKQMKNTCSEGQRRDDEQSISSRRCTLTLLVLRCHNKHWKRYMLNLIDDFTSFLGLTCSKRNPMPKAIFKEQKTLVELKEIKSQHNSHRQWWRIHLYRIWDIPMQGGYLPPAYHTTHFCAERKGWMLSSNEINRAVQYSLMQITSKLWGWMHSSSWVPKNIATRDFEK